MIVGTLDLILILGKDTGPYGVDDADIIRGC